MSNEEIVKHIREDNNVQDNMAQLWQQVEGLVKYVVREFVTESTNSIIAIEDLNQEGYIGLCYAVNHFDFDKDIKFSSYACNCVRWHLSRYLNTFIDNIRVPEYAQLEVRRYDRIVDSFQKEKDRTPEDNELCELMGITQKNLEGIKKAKDLKRIKSIYELAPGADKSLICDVVAVDNDMETDIIDDMYLEQLRGILWPMVEELPEEHRAIIKALYCDNKSLKAVADEMGMKYQMVQWRRKRAMSMLSCEENKRKLRPFMSEYIPAYASGIR